MAPDGDGWARCVYTEEGWRGLWPSLGDLLGAPTPEIFAAMVEEALGAGKEKIGVVFLTDLELLPVDSWFEADDLRISATSQNPYCYMDVSELTARFDHARAGGKP